MPRLKEDFASAQARVKARLKRRIARARQLAWTDQRTKDMLNSQRFSQYGQATKFLCDVREACA